MTVDINILVGIVSLAFGLFTGIVAMSRDKKHDDTNTAAQMTTVIVKLENISNVMNKIENEMSNLKEDIKQNHDEIIVLKESAKSAHNRLDSLENKISNTP